ncbi:MAG: glycoside hydrolase family 15 protein [Acidobacteriota bacterium]|nr:glycoside hydrolase family 15 protein [Acidobacteriota bacterium]
MKGHYATVRPNVSRRAVLDGKASRRPRNGHDPRELPCLGERARVTRATPRHAVRVASDVRTPPCSVGRNRWRCDAVSLRPQRDDPAPDGVTRLGKRVALTSPRSQVVPADLLSPPYQVPLETIFPPIADYAFLSDCENSCLIAPTGAVEWLCLPRPHDPSVFGTILDRSAGFFRLAPVDSAVPAHRQYVPGTMVMATTWQTRGGWLVVTDFLAVAPWYRHGVRSDLHRRTPGDYEARHVLVRTATCLHGSVDVVLTCEPSFDYGRDDAEWRYVGDSYDTVETTNANQPRLTLAGDMRFGIEGRSVRARHRLTEGETSFVVLGWGDETPPVTFERVESWRAETNRFWRDWIDGGRFPDHPWRELLQRSALTLKGLTYAPTGALLAAPTASLPENPGGGRNWDYRYTWIRDSAFTLRALHALGFNSEADDFLAFLGDVLEPASGAGRRDPRSRASLQVLYPVDGTAIDPETELDHLTGYVGSRPVRVGNAAFDQDQLDILGAIVNCVFEHTRSRDALSERAWRIVVQAVEQALACWREADRGIWEIRGEPQHFTFSKVMCWVAADRGSRLAALRGERERADDWWRVAQEIRDDVCANAVNADGCFTQTYGSDELDASLLVLPLMGFLPPDDERIRKTVLTIADELNEGAFVYRYWTDTTDDGMSGEPEGSFTVCSFWLVSALVEIGELERARTHCEKLIGAASSLGLYGEELDPTTARHLGNFPQALTHLSLINAVLHVIEAESRGTDGPIGQAGTSNWWNAVGRDERPTTIA